ncbi:MAG: hypothetical protein JNK27_05360 [Chitinophagaceae bacterium]|nr:hypothetical protein [Chitinophagaceae bacterium]
MKLLFLSTICLLSFVVVTAQKTNPKYDSLLAKQYGADEYGMKNYVLVILKTGSNMSADKALKDSCFAGHFQNMDRMVKRNKLIVAGPFGKNQNNFRGIFILDVASIEEARQLLQTDPAIKNEFLTPDIYPWYGSAALPAYLDASDKVWKTGF